MFEYGDFEVIFEKSYFIKESSPLGPTYLYKVGLVIPCFLPPSSAFTLFVSLFVWCIPIKQSQNRELPL